MSPLVNDYAFIRENHENPLSFGQIACNAATQPWHNRVKSGGKSACRRRNPYLGKYRCPPHFLDEKTSRRRERINFEKNDDNGNAPINTLYLQESVARLNIRGFSAGIALIEPY